MAGFAVIGHAFATFAVPDAGAVAGYFFIMLANIHIWFPPSIVKSSELKLA